MTVRRQCDRCQTLTTLGSMNDKDFRKVVICRIADSDTQGTLERSKELCGDCIFELEEWWCWKPTKGKASE